MSLRQTPYAQIALVCLRGLNLQDSRWLYFALISMAVITVAGGGIALEWGLSALVKTVIGGVVLSLQMAWVGFSAVLLRLNHSMPSRLVPGYVSALRRTALAIWLSICLLTGLAGMLDGTSLGAFAFEVCAAGAFMLLIGTPLRWPLRWCLTLVGIFWLARHGDVIVGSELFHKLITSRQWSLIFALLVLFAMAWAVTRMIAARGSSFASVFSRYLGLQPSDHVVNRDSLLKVRHFSPWLKVYFQLAHWAVLPWQHHAKRLLTSPQPGSVNALARAELGFGPSVHWVTQVSFSVGLAVLLVLVWWLYPGFNGEGGAVASPLATFYIGLVSMACPATSVMSIGYVMLLQQGEQKLMLLLPGMPMGPALNRLLAARHLRQACAAWVLAFAWVLLLPYPESVALIVAALVWGTLPFVPLVLQDWAGLRSPQGERALLTLLVGLSVPALALVALQWLQLPVWLLALVSVGSTLWLLRLRWQRLPRLAQAFPAGRFA
ncbi:MAG: hypothetical protein H7293_17825 [Candidatus Saccharibacteria bacterium]|nr:hypothetical protein [Rhodoferax sp.]